MDNATETGKSNEELADLLAERGLCADRAELIRALDTVGYFYYIGIIRPESSWCRRCHAFLKNLPRFMLNGMGVPDDWEELALWKND